MFAGRLTPVPRRVNRVSTEFAALFPQMASDEIAAAAGGADLRLSWREGVTGRRPRIGSGLSGQASAFYRCSSCTPRLRTFFIVQDASWQARGWAGLRMARFAGRGSGCARSSPLARGQRCREICICPVVSGRRLGAPAGTKMPAAHAATAAPSTADKRVQPEVVRLARGTSSQALPACFRHGGHEGRDGSPTGFQRPAGCEKVLAACQRSLLSHSAAVPCRLCDQQGCA